MKSGLEFLPVRGRLAAALVERSPGVAAFYSAQHPALDVRGHAAAHVQIAKGDNSDGANNKSNGIKHWGGS